MVAAATPGRSRSTRSRSPRSPSPSTGRKGLAGLGSPATRTADEDRRRQEERNRRRKAASASAAAELTRAAGAEHADVASAGARGGVPDRDAKGGTNPNKVARHGHAGRSRRVQEGHRLRPSDDRWPDAMPHHIGHLITASRRSPRRSRSRASPPTGSSGASSGSRSSSSAPTSSSTSCCSFARRSVPAQARSTQIRVVRAARARRRAHQPRRRRAPQPAARRSRARSLSRRSSRTRSSSACSLLVATFVFEDKLLTTSAVGAVVVGFALQDTLGNAFAGLAIQSEKPFRVGALDRSAIRGRVAEVTWRATKLRTKTGNFVDRAEQHRVEGSDHQLLGAGAPTRLEVEVGASYLSTPERREGARSSRRWRRCPRVLTAPPPDALLHAFDASAITYRVRFWIEDYELDDERARPGAHRDLLRVRPPRHRDPVADQVGYEREWPEPDRGGEAAASARPCWPASTCSRA